ncbi:MAG: response regulator, partial [Holophagales bacterium]|nr:response regulator [Holophagales bacterium]
GLQTTRLLRRSLPPGRQPVILALTGMVSEEGRKSCLEAGVDDILAKPFRIQDLQSALERWLGRPRSERTPWARRAPESAAAGPASAGPLSADPTGGDLAGDAGDPAVLRQATPFARPATGPGGPIPGPPGSPVEGAESAILDRRKLAQLRQLDDGLASGSLASQVIALFLDTVPGQLEDLRLAVQEGDRHRWRKVAHSLKNSSSTLGAEAVAAACQELEELSRLAEADLPDERGEAILARVMIEVRRALRALELERASSEWAQRGPGARMAGTGRPGITPATPRTPRGRAR